MACSRSGTAEEQHYRKAASGASRINSARTLLGGFITGVLDIPMGDRGARRARQAPLDVGRTTGRGEHCYEERFGEEIIARLPEATLLAQLPQRRLVRPFARGGAAQPDIATARAGNRTHDAARHQHGVTSIIRRGRQGAAATAAAPGAVLLGKAQATTASTPYVPLGQRWPVMLLLSPCWPIVAAPHSIDARERGKGAVNWLCYCCAAPTAPCIAASPTIWKNRFGGATMPARHPNTPGHASRWELVFAERCADRSARRNARWKSESDAGEKLVLIQSQFEMTCIIWLICFQANIWF